MDLTFMWDTFLQLLSGVPLTLNLAFTSVAFGAVLAMVLALMRMSRIGILDAIAKAYVFVFRGAPLLVQIFLTNRRSAIYISELGNLAGPRRSRRLSCIAQTFKVLPPSVMVR